MNINKSMFIFHLNPLTNFDFWLFHSINQSIQLVSNCFIQQCNNLYVNHILCLIYSSVEYLFKMRYKSHVGCKKLHITRDNQIKRWKKKNNNIVATSAWLNWIEMKSFCFSCQQWFMMLLCESYFQIRAVWHYWA